MKNLKKIASLLLALALVLSLAVTAFASGEGAITIEGAIKGEDYTAYKMFDLESFSGNAYSYKIDSDSLWYDFVTGDGAGASYVNVDKDGYITATGLTEATAPAFASAALAYAESKGITGATVTAGDDGASFSGLDLGYYLVDTTVGSLCSLNTVTTTQNIKEKNVVPTIEKEVKENSTEKWGETNDADLGETVEYKAVITVGKGVQNYEMHDKMTGLTFESVSKVTLNDSDADIGGSNYTVTSTGLNDGCSFEVNFENTYIENLNEGDKLTVYYTGIVNDDAVIAGNGNPNVVDLTYGDDNKTKPDTTITYVWEFDVFKFYKKATGEGESATVTNEKLAGAEFVLYKTVDGANKYATFAAGKLTRWVDAKDSATKLVSDADGKIKMTGLDSGTYYLEETAAPEGYNKLSAPVTVVIKNNGTVAESANGEALVNNTVNVENKSGTVLPSTGGMGTTLFYVVGGILVAAAVVLLVTKKRMSAE